VSCLTVCKGAQELSAVVAAATRNYLNASQPKKERKQSCFRF